MKKIFFILALASVPFFAQAQILGEMKDVLSGGGNGGGEGRGNGNANNSALWADLLFNFALEPTWWLLFRGPNERSANSLAFSNYPYADGRNGIYALDDYQTMKRMSLQLTGHLQTNQDAVFGGYFQAKWSPNRAFNLDVNHLQLLEKLEDERGNSAGTDNLAITNLNLSYNRVHHPKFQLWWGGGLMLLNGGGDELLYGSPSANIGLTWYFKKPLSFYADAVVGFPNAVYARQHQVRMQVHLKRFMVYAGYQGTKVGDVGLPNLAMGTGVWF